MSSVYSNFILYALIAIFAENAIFSRSLAVERTLQLVDDQRSLITFGVLATTCLMPASVLTYFAGKLIPESAYAYALRPLVFVASMVLVYLVMRVIINAAANGNFKDLYKKVSDDLHLAMFNSAVFGSLILCSNGQFTLTQTMGFCLGSGIGFTVATLYVAEGQRKIRNRDVPGSFKGLPVTLLYIGILSLCIYSFTGYSLGN